jgi:hypothetical protein
MELTLRSDPSDHTTERKEIIDTDDGGGLISRIWGSPSSAAKASSRMAMT